MEGLQFPHRCLGQDSGGHAISVALRSSSRMGGLPRPNRAHNRADWRRGGTEAIAAPRWIEGCADPHHPRHRAKDHPGGSLEMLCERNHSAAETLRCLTMVGRSMLPRKTPFSTWRFRRGACSRLCLRRDSRRARCAECRHAQRISFARPCYACSIKTLPHTRRRAGQCNRSCPDSAI